MEVKVKRKLHIVLAVLSLVFLISAGFLGWYLYDANVDRSGWVMQEDRYYYRDFHNHNVTGWQEIQGSSYYFNAEGVMQTGWLTLGENRYYLSADGKRRTGWLQSQDALYYLDETGVLQTGLQHIDGQVYLLDESGSPMQGLLEVDGNTYYFTPEGPAATGPQEIEGRQYFFSPQGTMQTGWCEQADGRRYYEEQGPMATGMQEIDGSVYYFEKDSGLPHSGWLTLGEYSYYFGEDGAALTGPQELDGRKHYFTPKGIHVILVNASNKIPDYYDPDLTTLFGWNQVSRVCLEPMKAMLDACEAAGAEYRFNSSYRSGKNQEQIIEKRTEEYMDKGMTYEQAYAKTLETVALPGTSEHEMGLAADIVGKEANEWLAEHCWEYGFILRYPPEKGDITGITYEPWHFRYVGQKVSMDMKDTGLCLEEYLGAGPA